MDKDDDFAFPAPDAEQVEQEELLDRLQGAQQWNKDVLEAAWAYHARHSAQWSAVLDLGCGFGHLLPQLSQRFERVVARDPDAETIELAKRLVRLDGQTLESAGLPPVRRGVDFDVAIGSDLELNIKPSSIDCIVAASSAHLVSSGDGQFKGGQKDAHALSVTCQWQWSNPSTLYSRLSTILRPKATLIVLGTKPIVTPPRSGQPSSLTALTAHPAKHLECIETSPSTRLGSEDLYSTLPKPSADDSAWDLASHRYWVSGPYRAAGFDGIEGQEPPDWLPKHVTRRLEEAREGVVHFEGESSWTPRGIAAWLRQTSPFVKLRDTDPRERTLASLDRDKAAQLVRKASEEDGVGWDERVGRSNIDVVWAISRR